MALSAVSHDDAFILDQMLHGAKQLNRARANLSLPSLLSSLYVGLLDSPLYHKARIPSFTDMCVRGALNFLRMCACMVC